MAEDVVDFGLGAATVVARLGELAGSVSSSLKKRSASGSAFEATFGAGGVAVAFAAVPADFAADVADVVVREAAAVVDDLGVVEEDVDFVEVDFAGVFEAVELVALVRSFLTLFVTLLTCPAIPLRSLPRVPFVSVTSAIVFSNSPESSEVMRRKSRTARPA